jgi:hypothetical protein
MGKPILATKNRVSSLEDSRFEGRKRKEVWSQVEEIILWKSLQII